MSSPITTHVLDTSTGKPAAGVGIVLERHEGAAFQQVGAGLTDNDGRLKTLLTEADRKAGIYRITFDTRGYFAESGRKTFFPTVSIVFEISAPQEHHHVPLLVSPYGYSTYRGS